MNLIVDSSAVIALIAAEPEAARIRNRLLAEGSRPAMAAPNHLEILMVLAGRHGDSRAIVDRLLDAFGIAIVPFSAELVIPAQEAFLRFGKGRHPAKLNFGDCIAYALARSLDAPLLFKGGDFALTDIVPAL